MQTFAHCITAIDFRRILTLVLWCSENILELNVPKSQIVNYCRRLNPIICNYNIEGVILAWVSKVRSFGVWFDSRFRFNER